MLVISSLLHSTHTPVVLFAAAEPHRDAFVMSIHVKRNGNPLICVRKSFFIHSELVSGCFYLSFMVMAIQFHHLSVCVFSPWGVKRERSG